MDVIIKHVSYLFTVELSFDKKRKVWVIEIKNNKHGYQVNFVFKSEHNALQKFYQIVKTLGSKHSGLF